MRESATIIRNGRRVEQDQDSHRISSSIAVHIKVLEGSKAEQYMDPKYLAVITARNVAG